jgi:4-hydroxybenzoate polyprenyltransferase
MEKGPESGLQSRPEEEEPPLIVDLDRALVRTDLDVEWFLHQVRFRPLRLLPRQSAGAQWNARPEPATLPYDESLLAYLRAEHGRGRRLWLASKSDAAMVESIAAHLDIFEGTLPRAGGSVEGRLAVFRERFPNGFDYAGGATSDLPLLRAARRNVLVGIAPEIASELRLRGNVDREFARSPRTLKVLVRQLRVYQWAKNVLLFLPLVGAHRLFDLALLSRTALGFLCFGLVASSVYVTNDLLDLESDRRHARKRKRPFASGSLSLRLGIGLVPALFGTGIALSFFLPRAFSAILAGYWITTLAYSLALKRRPVLDAMVLAALYTVRIYAGGFAGGVPISEWLASFSMFFFLSLAMVKRSSELKMTTDALPGRGYAQGDHLAVSAMGIAAGYVSVLVLALYISSHEVLRLYSDPRWLWLLCVLVLYWLSSLWLKAFRGEVDDDPLVFAMKDPGSWAVVALAAAVLWAGR